MWWFYTLWTMTSSATVHCASSWGDWLLSGVVLGMEGLGDCAGAVISSVGSRLTAQGCGRHVSGLLRLHNIIIAVGGIAQLMLI
jgi:hypothetical protein